MARVGIIGGSGYTGLELLRLLSAHPEVEIVLVTSRQYQGERVDKVFPAFRGLLGLTFDDLSKAMETPMDIVFTALPHGESMKVVPHLLERGVKVIDLSADFRLKDQGLYMEFYGPHTAPHLLERAVYGIPELYREEIRGAVLIANPGCYAIDSILCLAPLAKAGMLGREVIIDAKSGVSGAGRGPSLTTSFVEVNESFKPYKVAEHRHRPEIEQAVEVLCGRPTEVLFVPHLLPVSRGILVTVYVETGKTSQEELYRIYGDFYRDEPFIHLLSDSMPDISHVRGSNCCSMAIKVVGGGGRAIVIGAIDNLGKGAAGNAVQNMNIILGLPEETGLTPPLYP